MSGWVKMHRSIRKHWIHKRADYFKAWIDMIIVVNHKDNKELINGKIVECKRGESLYSLSSWVKIFGDKWTIQKVRTFFNLLESDNMICRSDIKKTTRLTIVNYNTYQTEQHEDNTSLTRSQHELNTSLTTTKECKERKECKEGKINKTLIAEKSAELMSSFQTFWENYGKSRDKKKCLEVWKKLKPDQRELAIFKAKEQSEHIEKQFRKDPIRWLKNECWNDEIIKQQSNNNKTSGRKINESSYS
jgi:hypothetical protein